MHLFTGILIGIAIFLPGISAGTLSMSLGIYDQLLFAFTHFFKQPKKHFTFIFPYITGACLGLCLITLCLNYFFKQDTPYFYAFFIGLIAGGIPCLFKKIQPIQWKKLILLLVLILLFSKFFSSFITLFSSIHHPMLHLFLIGILISLTLIIPGISGSMILINLGYYLPLLNHLQTFLSSLIKGDYRSTLTLVLPFIPILLGILFGILIFSSLISFSFQNYPYASNTLVFIIVLYQLIIMFTNMIIPTLISLILSIFLFILGYLITCFQT